MHHSHPYPAQCGRRIPLRMTFWLALALISLAWGQTEERPARSRSNSRYREPQVFVQLPEPQSIGSMTLERALQKLSTVEDISPMPLTGSAIGQLAWSAVAALDSATLAEQWLLGQVIDDEAIELYVVTYEGLFQYIRHGHRLQQLAMGDTRTLLTLPAGGLGNPINHGAAFIIADTQRRPKGRRATLAQRQTMLKVGQIAQAMRLQAAALGLASLPLEPLDEVAVRQALGLTRSVTPLYVLLTGYRPNQIPGQSSQTQTTVKPTQPTQGKPVVLMVSPENFQDQELQQVQQALTNAGMTTQIASTRLGPIHGIMGQTAYATELLGRIKADEIRGLIFIGGPGAVQLADNETAHAVALEALGQGKVVGALSIGVRVLATAGLLKQIRVTGHPSDQKRLTQAGAIFTGNEVELDGRVLTAVGPASAALFGRTLTSTLKASQ